MCKIVIVGENDMFVNTGLFEVTHLVLVSPTLLLRVDTVNSGLTGEYLPWSLGDEQHSLDR